MTKKWKRILCAALAFMMTSSLAAESIIRTSASSGSGSSVVAPQSGSVSFKNVTGQFDTTKIVTENFNSSVLENTEAETSSKKYSEHTLIVSLEGDGTLAAAGTQELDSYLLSKDGEKTSKNVKARQDAFLSALSAKKIPYTLLNRYSVIDNALAIRVNTRYVSTIKKMSGVRSAVLSQTYSRPETIASYAATEGGSAAAGAATTNETSVYKTGIYDSSAFKGQYEGEGMVVAVLDTGLDYTHEAYQKAPKNTEMLGLPLSKVTKLFATESLKAEDRTAGRGGNLTAKDVYVSDKVPFAYDYADDDSDVYPAYSNHGTHVAGIIGGSASSYTNKDGEIEKDEDGKNIPFIGVAPECQLVICKVFTDDLDSKDLGGAVTEDILAALEDCVTLGVDIINMSLGTTAGFTQTDSDDLDDLEGEYLNLVYSKIQEKGISLMAAASNDYSSNYGSVFGTNKASNPDSGVIGSPSTYSAAMSVASISGQKSEYLVANKGTENEMPVFYYESSDENSVLYDFLDQVLGDKETSKTLEYVVVPNYGTAADYTAIKSLFNEAKYGPRYALVSRGDNTFQEKVDIACQMGASGIIVYNNVAGMIRMNLGEVKKVIPAISINLEAGKAMRDAAMKTRVGTFTVDRSNLAGPFMSDFSSWGATPDLRLKPEITAHGGEITSTVPGGYDEQSGTSMATPNMAGFMALARSYVESKMGDEIAKVMTMNGGCTRAQAVTRLVNQLTMSTAVTARDQKGLPYSPRKQGAGLASLANVIGGTTAYLWTDGPNGEFNDFRPKIELFDKHFTTGDVTYSLEFNITNFGATALTFKTETISMTETLALDGFAVAEEAYILEKCQQSAIWSMDNQKISGGELTVAAGQTASIRVEITLAESEKQYIEKTFENGMYVEGFLRLNSTSGTQCDLAIPYMGFYGDWTAAPMLDYSVYEIDAAEQDTSIDDAQKPQASVYATQPFTSYYNDKYILPMGDYVYLLPDGAEPMYADMDKSSVSRYNEYYSEDGVTESGQVNYMTSTRVQAVYAGLLRNAKTVNYQLVDEYTGEVIHSDVLNRVGKAYNGGQSTGVPANVKLELYPDDYNLVANGKYRMDFEFFLDYGDGKQGNKNTFSFTFYVDYEAPQLEDTRIRYQTYTQNNKEKQKIYLDLDVYDNHYPQSVMLCYLAQDGVLEDGVTVKNVLQLATEYITPVRNAVRAGKTTVSIDITDIYEQYGSQLYVQVDDYSLNNSLYQLNLLEENADILPDVFELVEDEKMTVTVDRGQKVGNITLDVYETYKVKLDYEGIADLSNFTWRSLTESIVGVKNGEIVGLSAGTGRITIQNQKGQSKTIYVTVTDTVRSLSSPAISFGTIVETKTKAALKASGMVEVFAGKEFQLSVLTDPWYYPIEKQNLHMEWESKNPEYATVDENGYVRTLKEGLASILGYLKTEDGKQVAVTSVILNIEDEFLVSNFTLTDYNGLGYNKTILDENGKEIRALVLPDDMNIMYIGEEAFKNDTKIEYVVIPKTVVQIQKDAFENCTNLKKVYFISTTAEEIATSKLTLIHDQAFRGCTALERVDLSNVKKITVARQTFLGCVNLKEVVNMPAIGTMHSQAFAGCISLESVDLSGLHMSGTYVFYGCEKLKNVKTAKFTEIGDGMFVGCRALESIVINNPTVGVMAFAGCQNLKKVTFASPQGERLEFTIGDGAFSGCGKLATVNFGTEIVRSIGALAFENTALTSFTIPNGIENLGASVLAGSKVSEIEISNAFDVSGIQMSGAPFAGMKLKLAENTDNYLLTTDGVLYSADGKKLLLATLASGDFAVPSGVEEIGEFAFAGTQLVSVSIPKSVGKIGVGAFMGSTLASISFADDIELGAIEAYTFRGTKVTSVNLPSSVKTLGDYAFANASITSLTFEGEALGDGVFSGCTLLESIVLHDGIRTMGSKTFENCTALKSVTLPSVSELGSNTFNGAVKLENVKFGKNATTIGTETFASYYLSEYDNQRYYYAVPSLKAVTLPDEISEIPARTFFFCTNLQSVKLGGATIIGEEAFAGCASLSEVSGLENVTTIGARAFYGCEKLSSVNLAAATRVGDFAFALYGCKQFSVNALVDDFGSASGNEGEGYQSLSIPAVKEIGKYAFLGNQATTIALPASLEKIGDGAFAGATKLQGFTVAGNRYFTENGALYRRINDKDDSFELVCYPAGRDASAEDNVLSVKEGTVRVQAYAVSFLADGVLEQAVLPYSIKVIGDGAFYRSGILEYVFESVVAPALEFSYDQEVLDSLETINTTTDTTRAYFNNNFEECVMAYSKYSKQQSPLTIRYPENGVGYENFLYRTYFGKMETTGIVMTDETRAAIKAIDGFPTVDAINAWAANVTEENRGKVETLAAEIKVVRSYVNMALMDEKQTEYLTLDRASKLEALETALRAAKKAYGIEVKISRLSYDKDSDFKKEYLVGETFDMTGLVITVEYDDGSVETADLSKMTLVTSAPLTEMDTVVQLSGYGRTISIVIQVSEPEIPDDSSSSSDSSEVPDVNEGDDGDDDDGGCGSVVAPISALITLGAVSAVLLKKRKEDRE